MVSKPSTATLFQISASSGGVPKLGLHHSVVDEHGLVTDDQHDKVHHGGPDQDLCLYRLESILELQGEGHPIFPGSIGENLTIAGLSPEEFQPGRRYRIGRDVEIELTFFATPCKTIKASFSDGYFNRIHDSKYPGWSRIYANVLRGGNISVGDRVEVLPDESTDQNNVSST